MIIVPLQSLIAMKHLDKCAHGWCCTYVYIYIFGLASNDGDDDDDEWCDDYDDNNNNNNNHNCNNENIYDDDEKDNDGGEGISHLLWSQMSSM